MQRRRRISRRLWLVVGVASALLGEFAMAPGRLAAQAAKSEKILFVSNRAGEKKLNIFTMNPDGSEPVNLTKSDAMEFDPAWSPDRTRIAFAAANAGEHKTDIYVINADGSQRARLTKSEDKRFALAPAWSLDGKRIAYSTMQEPEPGSAPQTAIYLMDADGKNSKKLGEGLLPVWSPDGKKIAYSLFKDKGYIPSVYLMDADGSNAKMLAEKGVGSCWSPDGKRLLYMSEGGDNQPDIFVMNADGSRPTQLTKTPDAMEFGTLWSADGKRIFFTRFPKEKPNGLPKMQVYVMDADGSNVKSLTSGAAANFLGTGAGLFVVLSQVAHGE